jgi:hypothetical protein
MSEEQFCMRVIVPNHTVVEIPIASFAVSDCPNLPEADALPVCGKPARFNFESMGRVWWLCAECYDMAVTAGALDE